MSDFSTNQVILVSKAPTNSATPPETGGLMPLLMYGGVAVAVIFCDGLLFPKFAQLDYSVDQNPEQKKEKQKTQIITRFLVPRLCLGTELQRLCLPSLRLGRGRASKSTSPGRGWQQEKIRKIFLKICYNTQNFILSPTLDDLF